MTLAGTRGSGWDELVIVAMDAVAQAPLGRIGRDPNRTHDLADLATPAEHETLAGHPAADMARVRVELERTRVCLLYTSDAADE